MRTVILVLGIIFLTMLDKHWGLNTPPDANTTQFLAYLLVGCIALDIVK